MIDKVLALYLGHCVDNLMLNQIDALVAAQLTTYGWIVTTVNNDFDTITLITKTGALAIDIARGNTATDAPAPANAATGERYQVTGGSLSEVIATTIYTCACGMYSVECHETQHEGLHGYHVHSQETEFIVTEGVESFEAMRYKSVKEAITYCDNHCHLRESEPPQPDSSTPQADSDKLLEECGQSIAKLTAENNRLADAILKAKDAAEDPLNSPSTRIQRVYEILDVFGD